jgi:hypothetical protein
MAKPTDRLAPKYFDDELKFVPMNCQSHDQCDCGLTLTEAKRFAVIYYRNMAAHINGMTDQEFAEFIKGN